MIVLSTRDTATDCSNLISIDGRGVWILIALFHAAASVRSTTACIMAAMALGGIDRLVPVKLGW